MCGFFYFREFNFNIFWFLIIYLDIKLRSNEHLHREDSAQDIPKQFTVIESAPVCTPTVIISINWSEVELCGLNERGEAFENSAGSYLSRDLTSILTSDLLFSQTALVYFFYE